MAILYFITALIMLNGNPPLGWIQYTEEYSDKSKCKEVITYQKDEMSIEIRNRFGNKLAKILKWDCITHQEAVDRNTILGH
jgi:hypothetical protein